MKSLILSSAVLGLVLTTTPLLAKPDFDAVKAQVQQVAQSAGADTATLEKAVAVHAALRSDADKTTVDHVDNVLHMSAETAALVAGKEGIYCTLDKCPHAGSLADAKKALKELGAEIGNSKLSKLVLSAKLHHAASSIVKGTRNQRASDPSQKAVRSQVVKTSDEAKLELASQLAGITAKLQERK